jgi:type VI secretion system secreted protein Hcp
MRELVFAAPVSRASPKLLLACAAGQRVRSAVLSACRPGRELGSGVVDRVSLHFAKIQVEYRPQAADGTVGPPVKVGWDVLQNHAI